MRKAHIISIGNELLIGDTVNTNTSYIGRTLTETGFFVEQTFVLPDEYTLIKKRISGCLESADITVITGGLGPTHDDITKKCVVDLFDSVLVEDEKVLNHIKKIFKKRDFKFSPSNAEQALVPENCTVLFNLQGTAPGLWFEKNGRVLVLLPGVPFEMKWLMENEVVPKITGYFTNQEVRMTRYYNTAGVPESTISDDYIGSLESYTDNGVKVAYLPHSGGVTIRISTNGNTQIEANKKLAELDNVIQNNAGDIIYGEGRNCDLAAVVGEILAEQSKTIAVAESCTGGFLSNAITNVAGCSRYMLGGVISYSNEMKIKELNVSSETLNEHGAVSKSVALQMAKNIAEKTGASIGVSTTGIAGPDGGTKKKSVGTVWMGFWIDGNHFALKALFTNDRLINKERTVMVVLETVRRQLLGIDSYPYNLKPQS